MQSIPQLFDSEALYQHRVRASRIDQANFLQETASLEVSERLLEINRTFPDVGIIGPCPKIWAEKLRTTEPSVITNHHDTDVLDFEPASKDLIVHAMALHWANDPVGQIVQCRHALRPDGLFIAAMFGGRTLNELRSAFAEAEAEILGGISPRVSPMGDIRDLGALLQRAGLAMPVADIQRYNVTYTSPIDLMHDLRVMGETNSMAERSRVPLKKAILNRMCEIYIQHFGTGDGRIQATFEVAFLTGWAPHTSQPKPLRPGSATERLAHALGTEEISACDPPSPHRK